VVSWCELESRESCGPLTCLRKREIEASQRVRSLRGFSYSVVEGYLFGPITEQRYTSSVGASVISLAVAAAATSLSDNSCRGAWPALNVICTSRHSGLKPSP